MASWRSWIRKAREVGDVNSMKDWLRMLKDGNRAITVFEMGPLGNLVGEDYSGNKYYENKDLPYDRQRWVIYKDKDEYNPSGIPPEWHGWINYINDYPPTTHDYGHPRYAIAARVSDTGAKDGFYQPKGAWGIPNKRTWLKHEAWKP